MESSGTFIIPNLIIAGDLNFTLSSSEIWGSSARLDLLLDFSLSMLNRAHLVDVVPSKISLTWSHGRSGSGGISKRLDRFLISEKLASSLQRYRSWSLNSSISDHKPLILQIDCLKFKKAYPFKFNSIWLEDSDFNLLVRRNWLSLSTLGAFNPLDALVNKLKCLKSMVIKWVKDKQKQAFL